MQKQLRKPANWQDFETLCKKLWGEIWQAPNEIKKNGRTGQAQAGVDVSAIPFGQNGYWGIQCKGKDDYTNARLSKEEIDSELEKSRAFTPALEGLIFATTANKDAVIEQYVRELDLASRQAGGPKILLFCWEDIADLIEENRITYNWYILEQKFATSFAVEVGFQTETGATSSELEIEPVFVRKIKIYELDDPDTPPQVQQLVINGQTIRYRPPMPVPGHLRRLMESTALFRNIGAMQATSLYGSTINHATKEVGFSLTNSGHQVIEDWKVQFEFMGSFKELDTNTGSSGSFGLPAIRPFNSGTWVDGNRVGFSSPSNKPWVQGDTRSLEVYVRPDQREYTLPIHWHLRARDYSTKGELTLHIKPKYENAFEVEKVATVEELREPELISIEEKKGKG
ncbi:hypothetical protein [Hymenobacter negativus]|uniref:Mrr-like domain-containing protein n=1 Tax=Hymenobacter negativus TaxID=2795026 RepID=A0ABS3QI20_9BACT|nr:hypothetical protein [Hymenobacter negativus]MBO2010872.1 hypothetical protein [Hymenobacter negativus]